MGVRNLYQIGLERLCVEYAKNKSEAFNCFDNDCDILKVSDLICPQKKEEIYAKHLSISDREVYEQQKELVKTYLSKLESPKRCSWCSFLFGNIYYVFKYNYG
ncbi:MAG: hypothetical protein KAG53_02055 [Endozoicomonadaceae bacterium]|nr:hypothetical protein [Endozoicomonadaceae bacterium]